MADSCVYIPSKGASLFKQLKKQFGYEKAVGLFYTAINPKFVSDYKSTLSLDSEGVPSYESFMKNSYVRNQIENADLINSLQRKYNAVEDTQENYQGELEAAFGFNQTSSFNDKFIAIVEKQPNGKLRTVIRERNEETEDIFRNQYSSHVLNQRLARIFSPIGLTVGALTEIETNAGRVGVTDFNVAKSLAADFGSIIRVANNMEGAHAVSEEFSHLIIGSFIDEPLVQRSINMLAGKPELLKELLGDDYEDTVEFYDGDMNLVAEEALGHILQEQLLSEVGSNTPTLIKRALNRITSQFKDYDLQELEDALIEAETAMSSLAKDILEGTKTISQEDLVNKRREVQLNALSETVDRNIGILKDALKVEQKRYKIGQGDVRQTAGDTITEIKKYLAPNADVAYGLLSYAQSAVQQLKYLQAGYSQMGTMDAKAEFSMLRKTKIYIDSYGQFINALNNALGEDAEIEARIARENGNLAEDEEPNTEFSDLLQDMEVDGQTVNLREVLRELNDLNKGVTTSFYRHAKPAFAEFLKPFLGENLTIKTGSHAGETISVEQLLDKANSDISFTDRWLDAMGDSADTLLQLFDAVVKEAKDKARLETINNIQAVQKLRMDAEAQGITDFDYFFETDNEGNKTGNYLSEINYGQYEKDKREFMQAIEEKYGANPTGTDALAKINEIKAWHREHSASIWGTTMPKAERYKNSSFTSLPDNKREILRRFLDMKKYFDRKLPKNRASELKAIQIRKSDTQRMLDSLGNPSTLFANIKENVASSIFEREDDDQMFGNRSTSLTGFDGREFMTLPVLYTNRLHNPNELSNDVFASIMSYAYMSNTYEQMDNIIDQLEIGRDIVEDTEQRKVQQTRGNKEVIEKFRAKSDTVTNFVFGRQSNIVSKLDDFFESQIYGRYLKDEGTFDVFGKKVNIQKLTSKVLSSSSFIQLGFNWLANLANVTTGVAMQNIEAAAGQYFSAGELLSADKSYASEMKDVMAELTDRNKKSKLALFDQLFDIKQDFGGKVKDTQKKNWFERIFGKSWAFIGQESGDHWIYNRTAIAMAKRKKVMLNGKETNLWDALQTKDKFEGNHEIKELNYRDITELDGSPLDVAKFGRQVAHVNQGLFGIYNQDDAMAANRVAMGRLLMQYRKWIKPQMNKRFQAGQYSTVMDQWEEGYYRTVLRLGNDLLRGKVQLATCWGQMEDFEKKNVIRALTELVQFFAIWALANWVEWPDDKNRPWAMKMAEYSLKRLAHETGGLTPSTVMIQENLKTIKDPIASIGIVTDALNLFNSCISPEDWTNELQSGPYKGYSTLEKNIIKAPIPGVAQYRQIDKFVGELDNSIDYYARPSY